MNGGYHMKLVNIMYFNDKNDVDVISVPDDIYDDIVQLGQDYCNFLGKGDHNFWSEHNGKKFPVLETGGFVWWLNKEFASLYGESFIVKQHVRYKKKRRTIDF